MRYLLAALFLLLSIGRAAAGPVLTMEEAEKLFLAGNPEVKAKKLEVGKLEAAITEAQTLPNPVIKFVLESLQNGEGFTEETYSLSQRIDPAGKRGKKSKPPGRIERPAFPSCNRNWGTCWCR